MAISIGADLQFSIDLPTGRRGPARRLQGSVIGRGTTVEVTLDELPAFKRTGAPAMLRQLADAVAAVGLQVAVRDARGLVATIGAVRPNVLGRVLVGSRHVRLGRLGTVLGAVRRRGRTPWAVSDLAPPLTLVPLAPTFSRRPPRVTTTHDPEGGGRPRFYFPGGANRLPGEQTRVFYLRVGETTTIGSEQASHLQLDRVEPAQAEVRRDEWDEYWVVSTGSIPVRVNGAPVRRARMRTGTRVEIGPWTMVYFRAEYADHGRPYGGRLGGEAGHQIPQEMPQYRKPGR